MQEFRQDSDPEILSKVDNGGAVNSLTNEANVLNGPRIAWREARSRLYLSKEADIVKTIVRRTFCHQVNSYLLLTFGPTNFVLNQIAPPPVPSSSLSSSLASCPSFRTRAKEG